MATTISAGTNPYKLGSPPDFGTLYSGRALEFDGVVDYVDTGSSELMTTEGTVSAWVNTDVASTRQMILNKYNSGATNREFIFEITSGTKPSFNVQAVNHPYNSDTVIVGATSLSTGTWHHMVGTFSTSEATKIYLDGVLDGTASSAIASGIDNTAESMFIGVGESSTDFFNGKISNVQVWDKVWSLSDVQYAYTHPEKLITDNSAVTSGTTISNLKAWYPCTEGNPRSPQTTVYDGSGDGNHGTTTFYGDDLITNGQDWTGATGATPPTGWAAAYAVAVHTIADDGGTHTTALKLEVGAGANPDIAQSITAVVGTRYIVSFDYKYVSGSNLGFAAGNAAYNTSYTGSKSLTSATWTSVSYEFDATTTTIWIDFRILSSTAGHHSFIDNISIKEVGVSTGWTTADAEPLIPQTALMGMSKPMVFDGYDDKVDLGSDKPNDGTGAITISAWINPTTFGEGSKGRIIGNGSLYFYVNDSNDRLTLSRDNDQELHSANDSISTGVLQHVVVISDSDGDNTNFYINGSLSGTANQDATAPVAGSSNTFIGNSNAGDRTFHGIINEVAIWDSVLTLAEIQAIFNDGVALDVSSDSGNYESSGDLVGYWRNNVLHTDGKWKDLTESDGSGNNGTITGSPDTILLPEGTTSGKDILGFPLTHTNNGWLNLDELEYVNVPQSSPLEFGTGNFSVECWMKTTDSASTMGLVSYGDRNDGAGWSLIKDATNVDFYIDDGSTQVGTEGTSNVTDGDWHHIVVSVDKSANQILYVDNVAEDTDAVTSVGNIDTNDVDVIAIGRYHHNDAWFRYFNGSIDEVKIYNKALSSAEVTKNYKHGKGKHS